MSLKTTLVAHHRRLRPILPRGYHRYPVPGGKLYLDVRESPMMLARALGVYETSKMRAFREHLRPGMTVADVGANKGDFTLLAAQLVGPSGRVIAVEPGPENVQWLERSVDVSGYRNVECVEAALGEEPGTAPLHLGEFSGWHTMLTGGTGATVDVTVRTLDSLGPLNAVKIDVEGFEEQVLQGGAATLRDPGLRVVFLDLHPHLGVSVERTLALLTDAGLSVTELGEREALAVRR